MENENTNLEQYASKTPRIESGLSMEPMQSIPGAQTGPCDDISVIRLTGRLSLETVHDFISAMRSEPASLLVLDMDRVSFLDSAGVGALVALFVNRRNRGKKLALASFAEQGIAVLQVAGLMDVLPVCASVDVAIRQFKVQ